MGRETEAFEGLSKEQVLDVLRRKGVAIATIGKFTYLSRDDINIVLELEDRIKRRTLHALSRQFPDVFIQYFFHPEMIPDK